MSKFLTPAQQEYRLLANEADELSKKTDMSRTEQSRMSFLLAKMKAVQGGVGVSASDETREFFSDLFKGKEQRSTATMQEGTQAITYSAAATSGTLVPQEFYDQLVVGMSQFDPLLNKDIVTLIESGDGSLRPIAIPGWDLSTFAAQLISEGSIQSAQAPPAVSGIILNGFRFMCGLPVSMELEEDAYEAITSLMNTAFTIGMARGIGQYLVTGSGTAQPQGVLTAAGASVYTTAANNALVLNDFETVYFGVNRIHRASPKCAWLMNDASYQLARKAVDSGGHPLLKIHRDDETIMGKPVYVTPSLPTYNASLGVQSPGSFCMFGDLSHFFVRVSKMSLKRQTQGIGYIERGVARYNGLMRADSRIFDPTGGGSAPIVAAAMHE